MKVPTRMTVQFTTSLNSQTEQPILAVNFAVAEKDAEGNYRGAGHAIVMVGETDVIPGPTPYTGASLQAMLAALFQHALDSQ